MKLNTKVREKSLIKQLTLCGLGAGMLLTASPVMAGDSYSFPDTYYGQHSGSGGGQGDEPALSTGVATTAQVIDLGHDVLAPVEAGDAAEAGQAPAANEFQAFANLGYGNLTTDTPNGEVKSSSWGADLGLAKTLEQANGSKLSFAPIIDYGRSSFDNHGEKNGYIGHGKTTYFAGGFMARKTLENGFYYEGSLRYGRNQIEYNNDWGGGYDASTPVWAAHVHVGRNIKIDPQNALNIYGMYHYTHQNGIDLTSDVNVGAVDNGRLRLGARITRQVGKRQIFYTELAYQYNNSGSADMTSYGTSYKGERNDGSSAMLELGWQVRPVPTSPWTVKVNCTGWAGMQRGVTFGINLKKGF